MWGVYSLLWYTIYIYIYTHTNNLDQLKNNDRIKIYQTQQKSIKANNPQKTWNTY